MRPAAGALGLVVHPTHGAWKSMQKMWAKEQEQYQRKTRLSDGISDVQSNTKLDQDTILKKWTAAKLTTDVRKKKYRDIAEKEMYGCQDIETGRDTADSEALQASTSSVSSDMATQTSILEQSIEDEDTAFQRDLELAKQLSIAE